MTTPSFPCKTITTRYAGPTNTRGSRIIATATSGQRVTVSYDDALSVDQNHAEAARRLLERLSWSGQWFAGSTSDGYVFVLPSTLSVTIA